MALRKIEDLHEKRAELRKDETRFINFLRDVYGDKQCAHKIDLHLWRIRREIEIIEWVLDEELPF